MKVEITKEEVGVLSNEVIDSLNKSTSFQEYRRNLLKLSAMTPFALYFGLNVFAPTQAKAFLPLIALGISFLTRTVGRGIAIGVGNVIRNGVIRGGGNIIRGGLSRGATNIIGTTATNIAPRLITIGGIAMTATQAQAQARKSKFAHLGDDIAIQALQIGAESVWLKNEKNPAEIKVKNPTDKILRTDIFAKVQDVNSKRIDYEDFVAVVEIEPYSERTLELMVNNLPFDGIKILTGDASNADCDPSGKILIV